jgi:hypothetical protein
MIVNRLNKTKVEKEVDLAAEREQRDAEIRQERKGVAAEQVFHLFFPSFLCILPSTLCLFRTTMYFLHIYSTFQKRKEKEQTEQKKKENEMRSYGAIMKSENMKSNKHAGDDDDFM